MSDFQNYHASRLKEAFYEFATFIDEMPTKQGRIDLGTVDMKYGIEIKSSVGDLKSGYGLNQEEFAYPYVLVPQKCVTQALGWLQQQFMYRTGVICICDSGGYRMYKKATPTVGICKSVGVLEVISGWGDEILDSFILYDAYLWEPTTSQDIREEVKKRIAERRKRW